MKKKSGNILIVSYYLYPKYLFGGGRRLYFIRKYMEQCGYSCDIISADLVILSGRTLLDRHNSISQKKMFHSLRKYNPFPDSMLIWSIKTAFLTRSLSSNYDAVIVSAPPFSLIAAFFMRLHIKPVYIADLRDVWAEGALQEYAFPLFRFIDRFIEKRSLKHVKHIVSATKGIADIVRDRYGKRPLVLYNMLDRDEYVSEGRTAEDYLIYAGKIDRLRENRKFFDAIKNMQDVQILLAGASERPDGNNILYKGVMNREELLWHIEGARAGIILISFQSENEYNIFTSKLLDYMQLKKPILYIGPCSNASEFIQREGIGISVTENEAQAIRKGIEDIMHFTPLYTDALIERFHYVCMIEKSGFGKLINSVSH